ncbi:condensation domain-containing protein [Streptomyces sp. Qhu-G9]|uniref:condensation domain-containing protein n=1 Tax=Streptomyces sp. Qhu-G9 TaxID=3452799 RepID=UPI0022AC1A44|nr:condensation domain-containing protein [Streptomyces aurantiacus]WAU82272.1 condensation domain-containing protein [Streptomyces aurantiacus]
MNASSALTENGTGGRAATSRALSPGERWYWIIDQLSTLNVCARVRIEGELSAPVLRTALGALQDRHPLLRTAIAQNPPRTPGGGPRFVPVDLPIPLREVRVAGAGDAHWTREVDGRELTDPIDWRSGPLARAVLISAPDQTHDLILTVPHCIADGTTALSLLRQWVRLAAAPPPSGRRAAPHGPLPQPFEALFPERFRPGANAPAGPQTADGANPGANPGADSGAGSGANPGAAGGVGSGAAGGAEPPAAADADAVGRLEPERFVPFAQRRTRMLHRSLGSDVLEGLALACKREGATLHGVLAAALACAVARDAEARPLARFAVGSPVALRDELRRPVSEDEAGCFVSALHCEVRYQPEDLWSMARFINDDLAARKELGEQYGVFSLLAAQGPAAVADSEPFIRYIEEHGPFNFFVSNIGRFEFPAGLGTWQLSGAQFVGGISVVGYFGSSVSTSHGRLSWNFTHIDGAVSRERAQRIVDDSITTVLAASQ